MRWTIALILITLSLTKANPCLQIVKKLAPRPPRDYRITAYIKAQKDIQGQSQLEAPVNAGIKIEIPLYDARERYELQQKHIKNLDYARRLLADYLALRYEVEEMKKYISWQWQRVKAGIEYRKDIWKEHIKLKQKQGSLHALELLLISAGITKKQINLCYKQTIGEDQ